MIYLGADHRGFEMKESLKAWFAEQGVDFEDLGASTLEPEDDYPDIALAVALAVASGEPNNRGILLCNNGVGVDIVANKIKGIRSCLAFDSEQVLLARHDDDVNVLAIPAGFLSFEQIANCVRSFLNTEFVPEEKYQRRIDKIYLIENGTP